MTQPLATRSRLRNTRPGFQASRRLRASGQAGCFDPAGTIECVAIPRFSGVCASECLLMTRVDVRGSSRLYGWARMLIGSWRFPRPGRPEPPEIPRCGRLRVRWGRIQRFARSCQRGVVLSAGESRGAGRAMVFQHPSASAGFPEGIQVGVPLVSSPVAPELPGAWPFPQCRSVRGSPAGNAAPRLPRHPGLQADG